MRFDEFHSLIEGIALPINPDGAVAKIIGHAAKVVSGDDIAVNRVDNGVEGGSVLGGGAKHGTTHSSSGSSKSSSDFTPLDPFTVKSWLRRQSAAAVLDFPLKKSPSRCAIAIVPRVGSDYPVEALKVLQPVAERIHGTTIDPTAAPPDTLEDPRTPLGQTQFYIVPDCPINPGHYVLVWPSGTDVSSVDL